MSRSATTPNPSFLEHHSRPPQTKITCSLRPSTDFHTIKHLLMSGMNVVRIACAYGTQTELEALIHRVRDASLWTKKLCAIILETHGTSAMVGPVCIAQPTEADDNENHDHDNGDDHRTAFNFKNDSGIVSGADTSNHNIDPHDLQKLAQTLNLSPNMLPRSVLNNASFALNTIINTNQNGNDNGDDDNAQSQPGQVQPRRQQQGAQEEEEEEDEEKQPMSSSLFLPFSALADTASSSTATSAAAGTANNPRIAAGLSYDGDAVIIRPDIHLVKGSTVRIITDRVILGDHRRFSICFPGLASKLSAGAPIIIHPSIKLQIKSVDAKLNILSCEVLKGGPLKEYSKVELPSLRAPNMTGATATGTAGTDARRKFGGIVSSAASTLTQQDVADIGFAAQHGVDYLCVSHVKSVDDIMATKEMLEFQTATFHHMQRIERNTSYDLGAHDHHQEPNTHMFRSTAQARSVHNLLSPNTDDHSHVKILAKIENYACVAHMEDIIGESDGVLIDHVSLFHSYQQFVLHQRRQQQAAQVDEEAEAEEEEGDDGGGDDGDDDDAADQAALKEQLTDIIHSIIVETRKQAKPFSLCCDIQTKVLTAANAIKNTMLASSSSLKSTSSTSNANANANAFVLSDIEHDLKLLSDVPGIPININSFLTTEDQLAIEYCVAFGCDSVCVRSDMCRLTQIYVQCLDAKTKLGNKDILYLHGILRSITDVVKQREKMTYAFYQRTNPWNSTTSMEHAAHTQAQAPPPPRIHSIDSNLSGAAGGGGGASSSRNDHLSANVVSYQELSPKPAKTPTSMHDETADNNNNNNNNIRNIDEADEDDDSDAAYSDSSEARKIFEVESVFNSMASSAVKSAYDLNCTLIIVLTQSGRIARVVSKYRPHCIVLAITDSEVIARQCMFVSSIFPVLVLNMNGTDSLISRALYIANQYKLIKKKNDKVVVLAGTQSDILDEPCDFIMKLLYVDI